MLYFKASSDIEILDEYQGEKGIFLKTFAISDRRNKNGWRVPWESIKKNIHTFQDNARPGIEFVKCDETECDLDHTDGITMQQNIDIQEDFRVTTIIDHTMNEEDHKAHFIHKVHDMEFYEKVKNNEIKFVSPSIWPKTGGYEILGKMPNGQLKIDAWEWEGLHEAFLTKNPAFGDEARITATCEGEGCHMKLLTASELKANDLAPLQQIPILVRHKDKLRFVSVTECVAKKLQANLENDIAISEESLLRAISESEIKSEQNTSFSCNSCSGNQMDQKELENKVKELESKLKASEDDKKNLEAKLQASEKDESDKIKQAKKAMEEKEEEAKKAKKASEESEKENKELKAKLATPLIAKIISVRENAGMPKEKLETLKTSLSAKSISELEEKVTEDEFMMSNLSASEKEGVHFEFQDSASAPLAGKSLEETFEEVKA